MNIDELITKRNEIQLRAEAKGRSEGDDCWIKLGPANRLISRVLEDNLQLTPAVEREILNCFWWIEND